MRSIHGPITSSQKTEDLPLRVRLSVDLYSNTDKSKGTLLPLPARYRLGAPVNSRGLGKLLSD